MTGLIVITLIYIMPIGGMSFALFKLSRKYYRTWKNESNDADVRKKALVKTIFAWAGGTYCGVSCTFWLIVLWIRGFGFPMFVYAILFMPMVLIAFCAPFLFGLAKTVEAGAPSVTSTLCRLTGRESKPGKAGIKTGGKYQRRPEAEILIIKKRLKKTSYSPTMPIGVFVLSFLPCFLVWGDTPDLLTYAVPFSLSAFAITYFLQIIRGRSFIGSPGANICDTCHQTDTLGLKQCSCGGIFEPSEFYVHQDNTDQSGPVERK